MNGVQKIGLTLLLFTIFTSIVFVFMKRHEGFESKVVLSYFYLPSCGWCKKFNPEWDKFVAMVEKDKLDIVTRKVNAEEAKEEVMKEKIEGFPHVHIVKDGKRKDFEFNRTAEDLMKFVKESM
jgi:thiol-disulfide isomerase/thioredoxin